VVSNDLSRVEVGRAQYNLVLTEVGGIVDDVIVYFLEEGQWLLVPNAANTEAVVSVLRKREGPGVEVVPLSDVCTIAVQGPRALELVERLVPEAAGLAFMAHARVGRGLVVARSGYTGERGVELFVREEDAPALWRELVSSGRPLGLQPCGLGARDTLRLEMGYPLHGNDISVERTPLEAGLGWAVAFEKGEFTGREALVRQREEGIRTRLRGLRMTGRLIPRPHYPVSRDGDPVGETTSGSFSPTLRRGIAMAYLDPGVELGETVEVDVRGRSGAAKVVKPPFVDTSPK
jgi:aminomethyltransferase